MPAPAPNTIWVSPIFGGSLITFENYLGQRQSFAPSATYNNPRHAHIKKYVAMSLVFITVTHVEAR